MTNAALWSSISSNATMAGNVHWAYVAAGIAFVFALLALGGALFEMLACWGRKL